jgi:hypothetical protein
MELIGISPIILLLAFLLFSSLLIFIFWILYLGKGYILHKIKSNLFLYKHRGAWITYTKKDGRYFLYYVLIGKNKEIKLDGNKKMLGTSENTFIDLVEQLLITDDNKFVPSKNFFQGEPIYHLVEGCPTNVLIKGRDYEQDTNKLKEIIKIINSFDEETDPKLVSRFKANLTQALTNLYVKEFKYLPSARTIVADILEIEGRLRAETNDEGELINSDIKDYSILHHYLPKLDNLYKLLAMKDKTIVNYDELHSQGQLDKIFNQSAQMNYIAGVMKNLTFKNFDKIMWMLIIIAIVGFVAVGYMVHNLDGRFDELNVNINSLLTKIKEVTLQPQIQTAQPQNIETLPNFPTGGQHG